MRRFCSAVDHSILRVAGEVDEKLIDRAGAVPLYHQIFLQIRDEILSGERAFQSRVPTEQELSVLSGVSRITARRALNELADAGFVERRRRLGTRVSFRSPAQPIEGNIDQAVDSLLAFGRETTVRVIEVVEETPTQSIATALQTGPNDMVIRAVRLRLLDGAPLGYVVSYVPAHLASVVTSVALQKIPILRLLTDAGCKAAHAEQTIGAITADIVLAQALETEPRAALLRIVRTVYDIANRPYLITFAHYRADRFTIRLDLHGPAMTE